MNVTKEIIEIEERNARVEAEKAWETCWFRVITVCIVTYITTALLFAVIGVKEYYLNALIPTTGFFLSTLSLPPLKKWWINKHMTR